MATMDFLESITQAPILPTVYPIGADVLCGYADALADEGYPALEVLARPMEQAATAMNEVNRRPQRRKIRWGLGTVRTHAEASRALELKPDFMVSPAFSKRLLALAVKAGVPYVPGVRTFQDVQDVLEAFEEHDLEVRVLKLCPVYGLNADYVAALRGCFPGVAFCPTGEITWDNYAEWKRIPGIVAPMGSRLVPQEWLAAGDFKAVRHRLRQYRQLAAEAERM